MPNLYLPSPINFQVQPGAIALNSLVRRLYNSDNIQGPFRYPRSPYALGDFNADPFDCDSRDIACVQRNVAASVAYQTQNLDQQAASNFDRCIANGTDSGTCSARWPSGYGGETPFNNLSPDAQRWSMETPMQSAADYLANPNVAGELQQYGINPATLLNQAQAYSGGPTYSGSARPGLPMYSATTPAPKPNQSVPPTTPLTPMATGFQNTASAIAQQTQAPYSSGHPSPGGGQASAAPSTGDGKLFGMDQTTVLLIAGVGAALFFMGGKR